MMSIAVYRDRLRKDKKMCLPPSAKFDLEQKGGTPGCEVKERAMFHSARIVFQCTA